MSGGEPRFYLSSSWLYSLTVVTFKVTPVSRISAIFLRSTEEEEKEERVFPQAFPNIQNRVVTKANPSFIGLLHLLSASSRTFSLFSSCDTSFYLPSIIISSSLCFGVYCFVPAVYFHFPTCCSLIVLRT